MSEKKKPKNVPVKKSEDSDEEPMFELSPGDAEDKWLLSPPSTGAEAFPVASGSGACASRSTAEISGFFKKLSPFKSPFKSKDRKCKTQSSLENKAKKELKRPYRKSDSHVQVAKSKPEEKRGRKISDPTDLKTKVELKTESEPKKGLFGSSTASTSKTYASEETKGKAKKAKDKKGFFKRFSGSASKELSVETDSKKETKPGPSSVQKKILSPKTSNESSIGGVSLGFFNQHLASSESSGVPTESASVDTQNVRSGINSPDAAAKRSSIKRPRANDSDEESSLSDPDLQA